MPKLNGVCHWAWQKSVQRKQLSSERVERHTRKLVWGRKAYRRELFVPARYQMNMNIQAVLSENHKKILVDEAFEVDALLKKYVDIHNKRLKAARTFVSLFKKVDFKAILDEVNDIFWEFNQKRVEVAGLRGDYSEYSTTQQHFCDIMESYFDSLFEAVEMLQLLADKQYQLSQGLGKGKLTLKEDLELEKKYKEKIRAYTNLGTSLNKSFKEMSEEN